MDVHGGSLSVFSEGEGYGSTFTLELNLKDESTQGRSAEPRNDFATISMYTARNSFLRRMVNTHRYSTNENSRVQVLPASIENISFSVGDRSGQSQSIVPQADDKNIGAHNQHSEWKNDDLRPLAAKILSQEESLYSVLMVDDSIPTRSMLSKLLQSRCRKLDQAGDGVEALRMVEMSKDADDPYDIILMDSEMPNMNGPAATRLIREQLGYKGLIIGVTGNALPDDIANFKDHGADDVLVKPLKINQFDEVLSKIRCRCAEV